MKQMTDPQAPYYLTADTGPVRTEPAGDDAAPVLVGAVGEWKPERVDFEQADWYNSLVDDCHAIITEAVFTSRWALVEGYWMLGRRIVADSGYQRHGRGNGEVLQGLAKDIGLSERTLYYALQFYAKYPRLDAVPDGKNISWNKLITKYLPGKAEADQLPPLTFDMWLAGFTRRLAVLRGADLSQLPRDVAEGVRWHLEALGEILEGMAK